MGSMLDHSRSPGLVRSETNAIKQLSGDTLTLRPWLDVTSALEEIWCTELIPFLTMVY